MKSKKSGTLSALRRATEHRPGGGGKSPYLRLPSGVEKIIIKEDIKVKWSIVPFTATKMNPVAYAHGMVGELYFERTFHVHPNVGPEQLMYACPYHNTKHLPRKKQLSCPICNYRTKLLRRNDEDDADLIRSLLTKERQLWLVYDHDNPKLGVRVFDASFHALGKDLDEAIREDEEDGTYQYFASPGEAGSILKIKFAKTAAGAGRSWFPASRIDFVPRGKSLKDSILDHGIDLDACIDIPKPEELSEIFFQGQQADDDDDVDDDDNDDVDDDEEEDTKPAKKKRRREDDDD